MTNEEVVKRGWFHGISYEEVDESTNRHVGIVYDVDGELWMVEELNGHYSDKYPPIKMKAVPVQTWEYEPIES